MRTMGKVSIVVLIAAALGALPAPALATPPSNDAEAGAVSVEGVPFTHSTDTTEATGDGPTFCSNRRSVFYTFTPAADVRVQVDTLGSDYDTTLAIYTRDEGGHVRAVSCNRYRLGSAAGLRLRAEAGTTYLVMAARCCGNGSNGREGRPGGRLVITVTEVSDVPLDFVITIDGGTVDPSTGIATISGTITCTKRSIVYAEAELRQLRDGLFIARGGWYAYEICTPDDPVELSIEVDSYTSVAFDAGAARSKIWYSNVWAGWRESVSHDTETATVSLV